RHVDGPLELARGEHLHAVADTLDGAELDQPVRIKRVAFQAVQPPQIDDGILLLENVGEAALGQTPVQRHLAALESAHHAVAGDGPRAFRAAPAGLAESRAHAAPDALLRVGLPGRRMQVAEVHLRYSTTASRCGIFFTMPRNPGVSGRSTTWLIFFRPRL